MRLIDADELLKHIPSEELCSRMAVANAPTIEPQEIIRCKDCKWSDISATGHLTVCNHVRGLVNASPNSYCNFAERRTTE